jgi:hypothetical protein
MPSRALLALSLMTASVWSTAPAVDAASRAEVAAIHVQKAADFKYWNANSPTIAALTQFVENAVNPASKNYIPPEARIATFDLDGTLYCETAPYYFQEMMFLQRALEDQNYQASPEMKAIAQQVKPYIMDKKPIPKELGAKLSKAIPKAYKGMTPAEYKSYVQKFMDTNETGRNAGQAYLRQGKRQDCPHR